MAQKGKKYAVGIDLGGTKIAVGMVDEAGHILSQARRPTGAEEGYRAVIGRMADAIRAVAEDSAVSLSEVSSIGVGVPGTPDFSDGTVIFAPNIGWRDVPLGRLLREEFGLPVYVDYDTNAAALGEYMVGAGKGARVLLFVTVGTGVGAGIVFAGKLFRGATGIAGEIGHMVMDKDGPPCTCGNIGCLQMFSKGPALADRAAQAIEGEEGSRSTVLRELLRAQGGGLTGEMVIKAAREGDPIARKVFEEGVLYLGLGIANAVSLLNPDVVVVGGGIAKAGDLLFKSLVKTVKERAYPMAAECVDIRLSMNSEEAAIVGAAMLEATWEPLKP
ncbi:MAG TPA: ROK family protein [Firmicutes bacterium]|nr:ROK family protein [Bacillota bacterium]